VTDDSYTRVKGEPQGNLNVLTNDWTTGESFLNILTLSVVTPPTNDVDADFEAHIGHFHYTAQPNFVGVDTFTYEICNYDGFCDIATVTVTVTP